MSDTSPRVRIECPIWHSPIIHIVPTGIEIRCKSCRGVVHHISRERIEQTWQELNQPYEQANAQQDLHLPV